jgi:Spy/CpxP family protein refolding chaperone
MRHIWLGATALFAAASLAAAPASSQERQAPSGPPPARGMDRPMREQVQQRFAERVQEELKLTEDQASRLRTTTESFAKQRGELRTHEQALRKALAGQLRPGIAANNDSVAKLTEQLVDLRIRYAETFRGELKDLSGFLTPVQRARLFSMRERLFRAADQGREGRRPMGRRGGRPMDPPMDRPTEPRKP